MVQFSQVRAALCELFCKHMTDVCKYSQEEAWKKMDTHTQQKTRKQESQKTKEKQSQTETHSQYFQDGFFDRSGIAFYGFFEHCI